MRKQSTPLIPLECIIFSIGFLSPFACEFSITWIRIVCANLNSNCNMRRCQHRRLLRIKWRIQPQTVCILYGLSERLVLLISSVLRDGAMKTGLWMWQMWEIMESENVVNENPFDNVEFKISHYCANYPVCEALWVEGNKSLVAQGRLS